MELSNIIPRGMYANDGKLRVIYVNTDNVSSNRRVIKYIGFRVTIFYFANEVTPFIHLCQVIAVSNLYCVPTKYS